MAITQEQKDKDAADYADQFGADEVAGKQMSEDEAFGIAPEDGAGGGDAGASQGGGTAGDGVAQEPDAAAAAAGSESDEREARLRDWEATLKAKEEELKAREVASSSHQVDEHQTSRPAADAEGGINGEGGGDEDGADDQADPGKAIAADFGDEFLAQLVALIDQRIAIKVDGGINGMQATVDSLIDVMQSMSHASHFKTIREAHKDFEQVIASPEFEAYRAKQSPAEQGEIDRVVASGSAQEVIDILTKFKQSKEVTGAGDDGASGASDDELDAAEGVSAGAGLRLPSKQADDSYESAWNAA